MLQVGELPARFGHLFLYNGTGTRTYLLYRVCRFEPIIGAIIVPGQTTTSSPTRVNKVVVNKPQPSGQYDKSKKNKPQRTKESTRRQAMLNTHRINPFKYDMNQILETSTMDPAKASSFLASVIAKASRVSTKEAKEFIKTFLDAGDLTKDEADKINKLLDKYSKYR